MNQDGWMKDREGYNKGGDKREGGLIDVDQNQTISRNSVLKK